VYSFLLINKWGLRPSNKVYGYLRGGRGVSSITVSHSLMSTLRTALHWLFGVGLDWRGCCSAVQHQTSHQKNLSKNCQHISTRAVGSDDVNGRVHKEHAVYLVVSGVLAIGHQSAGISLLLYKSSDDNPAFMVRQRKEASQSQNNFNSELGRSKHGAVGCC